MRKPVTRFAICTNLFFYVALTAALSLLPATTALAADPASKAPASKASSAKAAPPPFVSAEGQTCLTCHTSSTPGIVEQWRGSAHARGSVDCYSCHKAAETDPAGFDHYGQKIAVIVTPNYCARCHKAEYDQFEKSHHANA